MPTILEEIVERKINEVKRIVPRPSFKTSLKRKHLTVIAEIKRRSPSAGSINTCLDILEKAKKYIDGGASAISVLTDEVSFGGSCEDLERIAKTFPNIPILRKDFIVDPSQLEETVRLGANAVLLIASVLGNRLPWFIQKASTLGLEALVEVHTEEDLKIAIHSGAEIIGVNNRNLQTFEVDLSVSEKLSSRISTHVVKVSESGIKTPEDAHRMKKAGYHAVLIGETLMRESNPAQFINKVISHA